MKSCHVLIIICLTLDFCASFSTAHNCCINSPINQKLAVTKNRASIFHWSINERCQLRRFIVSHQGFTFANLFYNTSNVFGMKLYRHKQSIFLTIFNHNEGGEKQYDIDIDFIDSPCGVGKEKRERQFAKVELGVAFNGTHQWKPETKKPDSEFIQTMIRICLFLIIPLVVAIISSCYWYHKKKSNLKKNKKAHNSVIESRMNSNDSLSGYDACDIADEVRGLNQLHPNYQPSSKQKNHKKINKHGVNKVKRSNTIFTIGEAKARINRFKEQQHQHSNEFDLSKVKRSHTIINIGEAKTRIDHSKEPEHRNSNNLDLKEVKRSHTIINIGEAKTKINHFKDQEHKNSNDIDLNKVKRSQTITIGEAKTRINHFKDQEHRNSNNIDLNKVKRSHTITIGEAKTRINYFKEQQQRSSSFAETTFSKPTPPPENTQHDSQELTKKLSLHSTEQRGRARSAPEQRLSNFKVNRKRQGTNGILAGNQNILAGNTLFSSPRMSSGSISSSLPNHQLYNCAASPEINLQITINTYQ